MTRANRAARHRLAPVALAAGLMLVSLAGCGGHTDFARVLEQKLGLRPAQARCVRSYTSSFLPDSVQQGIAKRGVVAIPGPLRQHFNEVLVACTISH